jgi:uroporphyrinogen-III decarboxylase
MSGKMAGVDKIRPLERAAGMDARKLRREYGRDLILMGNVDKRALAEGREAIDKEVEMVKELIHTSGYFVNADHFISTDVSYEKMKYFHQ